MRWTQAAHLTRALCLRTAKSCGPDAPTLASSWRRQFHRRWWQTSPVTGESAEETVKTIARGMPGVSGVTVVTNSRVFYLSREAAGASGARHSLLPSWGSTAPSDFRRQDFSAKLGRIAPRDRGVILYAVIAIRRDRLFEIRIWKSPAPTMNSGTFQCPGSARQPGGNEFCLRSANHKPGVRGLGRTGGVSCCVSSSWPRLFHWPLRLLFARGGWSVRPHPCIAVGNESVEIASSPGTPTCMSVSPTIRRPRPCGCRSWTAPKPPISPLSTISTIPKLARR